MIKLQLSISMRDPKTIKASPNNARTHSAKQIAQIGKSIATFGFTNPILIDDEGTAIAGHGRLAAALGMGLSEVPVIVIGHLTAVEKRALMLADNKIALNSSWDLQILRKELIEISSPEVELSEIAGFDTAETDNIIDGPDIGDRKDPLDVVEEPIRSKPAITKPGDLWQLGNHLLLCGDALQAEAYSQVLGSETATMVLTDAPYNLSVEEISGLGRTKHPEFKNASGEMTRPQFQVFLNATTGHMRDHCVDGAILMIFMDWRHIDQLLEAGRALGIALKNICVWVKTNGGMGSLYRSQHEMIAIFKKGTAKHVNTIELGVHGRYRTNVWRYAGANTFRRGRKQDLETHPTVKPIALLVDAIKDCSRRSDIILDAFGGSGSTLLAAERVGRRARLIEIDPYYCDATIARWCKMTGGEPQLISGSPSEEAA